jgi:hypothetical protein
VRISARNSLGYGIASTLNTIGVLAQVQPHKPATVPQRGDGTGPDTLVIEYDLPIGELTGGSSITSLQLQWDQGTGDIEWMTLVGEDPYSTSTSFTISENLVPGRTYLFKYRTRNIFGWGEWSDKNGIMAASIPETMAAPVTSLIGLDIKVEWEKTTVENGSPITAYEVQIRTSDSSIYVTESVCDGSEPITFA